jgi:cytidine deaminase
MTTMMKTDHTDELARLALDAKERAYAPYSKFRVGAALRAADGRVFTGANVENASYGLTVCAERTAIVSAVSAGARDFTEIVVALDSSPPVAPCGLCRQMLAEFARDLPITIVNDHNERVETRLSELLPRAFRPDDLLGR